MCACVHPRARRAEFEADAKGKAEELGALLAEREEEFYSYQNTASDDDYDDEDDVRMRDANAVPRRSCCVPFPLLSVRAAARLTVGHRPRIGCQEAAGRLDRLCRRRG